MPIIVVQRDSAVRRLEREIIGKESSLEEYIKDNPDALPLDDIKPGGRLLIVGRQFRTESGPIDTLAIDADGAVYVIEMKLYKNPDKRRVVAQMLDYGAALWSGGVDAFMTQVATFGELQARMAECFSLEDDEIATAVASMEANIEAGRFTFIVLMDQLDERLKELINFVNANSRFTLLGLELEFYRDGDRDLLIPHLYGTEVRKAADAGESRRAGRRWTETEYFERAHAQLTPNQMKVVRELYEWAQEKGQVAFATGNVYGGFTVQFPSVSAMPLFKVTVQGTITIRVARLGEAGEAFRDALQAARLFSIAPDRKKPSIEIEEWMPVRDRLFRVVEEFVSRHAAPGS